MALDLTELSNRLNCLEYLEGMSQLGEIKSVIFNDLQELNDKLLEARLEKEAKEKEETEAKAKADAERYAAEEAAKKEPSNA